MALIYIIEDDKNIREIESFALRNAGHQVIEFESAEEYYKMVLNKTPNLILLDVMLPDEDGLSVLTTIRRTPETRKVPVILITAKTTEIDRVKGLDLGADDCMIKPFGVMELISKVKAILRRVDGIDRERFLRVGVIYIDDERHEAYVNDVPVKLTYKEYELLKYLTTNQGVVLSRESIMEKIWNYNYGGGSRTLDVHIKTLRQKLNEAGSYIKTVRNVGYFLDTDNAVKYTMR